jgi:hypothetical protein
MVFVLCPGEPKLQQTPSLPTARKSPSQGLCRHQEDPPKGKAYLPPGGLANVKFCLSLP